MNRFTTFSIILFMIGGGIANAQSTYGPGMMNGPGQWMMNGMMIIPLVIGLLIIVLLVVAILALIKYLRQ
jgi:hypothetical protein